MEAYQVIEAAQSVQAAPVEPAKMEVCCRHGKKRQQEYMVLCPGTDNQWQCRDNEQCKMSMKPSKKEKEIAFMVAVTLQKQGVAPMKVETSPTIEVSTPSTQNIELYSTDAITSWADEVDKEFPLTEIESKVELLNSFNNSPSLNTSPRVIQQVPESPANLLGRVGQLEDELSYTKHRLSKTKEEMNRALRNERLLESKLRSLCSEIARLRQERTQFNCQQLGLWSNADPSVSRQVVMANSETFRAAEYTDASRTPDGMLSPQYVDSAGSSLCATPRSAAHCPEVRMDSARSVQFLETYTRPNSIRIDSSRSSQHQFIDSARSSFIMDGMRSAVPSARSSVYSYGTPYSVSSMDDCHYNGR